MESQAHPGPCEERKLILVLGATGCGKTTFVNLVSGSNLMVGHGLQSCTTEVQEANFELASQFITIVDTPGFDDTEIPQSDVLNKIATCLENLYAGGTKPAGVIYMHRISDSRIGGAALATFRMFRKICGDNIMKNIAVVTNMWEGVDPRTGEDRERELKDKFFRAAFDGGANLLRHDNSLASARNIIYQLLGNVPEALRVQDEMVVQHKTVPQTEAGIELQSILDQLERGLEDKMARSLEKEVCKILEVLEKVRHQQQRLKDAATATSLAHPEPAKESQLILVLGPIGCGKTTFTNLVSGERLAVGDGFQPCSTGIQPVEFKAASHLVTILDTPGFEGAERPQEEVHRQLAGFLEETYKRDKKIAGVIYMHRISGRHIDRVATENVRLFHKFCEDHALTNVTIVNNGWENVDQVEGERRETELKNNVFKAALDGGARLRRHDNSLSSARKIMCELLERIPGVPPTIEETVAQRRASGDVRPNVEIGNELERLRRHVQELTNRYEDQLEKRGREAQELRSRDEDQLEKLRKDIQELGQKVERIEQQLNGRSWWSRIICC